jgi:hypothetical protein
MGYHSDLVLEREEKAQALREWNSSLSDEERRLFRENKEIINLRGRQLLRRVLEEVQEQHLMDFSKALADGELPSLISPNGELDRLFLRKTRRVLTPPKRKELPEGQ